MKNTDRQITNLFSWGKLCFSCTIESNKRGVDKGDGCLPDRIAI